jgi:hypothetical protein
MVGQEVRLPADACQLGIVARAQEEYELSQALHQQGLAIQQDLGDKRGIVESLEGLAEVVGAGGQTSLAARLSGAAEAQRLALGMPQSPRESARMELHLARIRSALGEEVFSAARAAGRSMPLEEAIAIALQEYDIA